MYSKRALVVSCSKYFNMKTIAIAALMLLGISSFSQRLLTTPPSGGNKKAAVKERIGITDVTINYDRPRVNNREGKIWGQLVPVGYSDQQFGTSKAAPWRAGANKCTTIEFSTDVKIEGQYLAAGKYGFFIAYGPEESTIIFSRDYTSWGSFYYDASKNVLTAKIKPVALDKSVEWLKYEFINQTENSATIVLSWEKLSFPIKVEIDLLKTQIESFRKELRTDIGFTWMPWQIAAQWCVDHNTNLEEALQWADTSINPNVLGNKNFTSLSTKSQVLVKLGRNKEADAIMKEALPLGTMQEIHLYGRELVRQKKNKEALEVFQLNYNKNPNQFTTLFGLARGYSANGDYKKALEYATKALPLTPDKVNTLNVEKAIGLLKEGKDIN